MDKEVFSFEPEVTPIKFQAFIEERSIVASRLDEATWRFAVPTVGDHESPGLIQKVDTVYQGDGRWSTATPLFRVPDEDTPAASALLRATLEERSKYQSGAGIFIDQGIAMVGHERVIQQPEDLISGVVEVARTATPLWMKAHETAIDVSLQLLPLPTDESYDSYNVESLHGSDRRYWLTDGQ